MKNFLFFILITVTTLQIQAQKSDITTYYFIRHAEKVRTDKANKNPNLTKKGLDRAENWNTVFGNVNFDLIYSTNYNRTVQTAIPTAKSKNLEIQFYNPRELYNKEFQIKTKGKIVLIVGHSNTTPMFVNKVIGKEKYSNINDHNNSNLYIVTISKTLISDVLLKIDY